MMATLFSDDDIAVRNGKGEYINVKDVVTRPSPFPASMPGRFQFYCNFRIHWPAFEGECEVRPLEGVEPK
jgi:hypothetical protein